MIDVQILNKSENALPGYKTEGSAGFDLASNEDVFIAPGGALLLSTGVHVAIPKGYEGQLRLRSSMWKKLAVMPNAPGTIDSDYRGEVKIPLRNVHAHRSMHIYKGERIAQLVISEVPSVKLQEVSESDFFEEITERGEKGFGSTGHN